MNIIIVKGSCRSGSISSELIDAFASSAIDKGHSIKNYDVGSMKLFGCQGCGECRRTGCFCVMEDELQTYWNDLQQADLVVLGVPMYMGQPSGQMMSFMNRHYCLKNSDRTLKLTNAPKLITIFSQGAPADYAKYFPAQQSYINVFVGNGFEEYKSICVGGNSDIEAEKCKISEIGSLLA